MLKKLKDLLNTEDILQLKMWRDWDGDQAKSRYGVSITSTSKMEDHVGTGPTLEKALAHAVENLENE